MLHVEQMKKNIKCPTCEESASRFEKKIIDHMVSKEVFDIRSCVGCGLWRTEPRPTLETIGNYYDSPNYLSHSEESQTVFKKLYNGFRSYNAIKKLKILEDYVSEKSNIRRLLDVGCGIGVFLEHAKFRKWNVFGIETNKKARKIAEKRLKSPILENIDDLKVGEKFDAISLWHVLEHLTDPNQAMKKFHHYSTKKAILVIGVPNRESYDAKLYDEYWAAYDVPIHFWHFTKKDIKNLAEKTGWKVEVVLPMRLDAFYVSLLSELYKYGRKNWIKSFLLGLISNYKGGQTNTSSLVYVLKKV